MLIGKKPAVVYEVVLENNTDFILRRQTQRVCRELVILVSQGLYYIRDCKTGAIDPVTNASLRSFLRHSLLFGLRGQEPVHPLRLIQGHDNRPLPIAKASEPAGPVLPLDCQYGILQFHPGDDVYQELAMAALNAIETFDPMRSECIQAHIWMRA